MEKSKNSLQDLLDPLTTEHSHVLQLCQKIRMGLNCDVELNRIKSYADWFNVNYLKPHFEVEEKYIFPYLGNNNVRVKRALANHRRLKRLFARKSDLNTALNLIEEELEAYIRFEEKILYKEILSNVKPNKLSELERLHEKHHFSNEDWEDKYWTACKFNLHSVCY